MDPYRVFMFDEQRRAYELISGRCFFTGSWCRDYCYHVLNWHPLISCFFCDPVNPYTKWERVVVLLTMTTVSMLPTALIQNRLQALDTSAMDKRLIILWYVTIPVLVLQYLIEYAIFFRAVFGFHASRSRMGCCCRIFSLSMGCCKGCCLWSAMYLSILCVCIAGALVQAGDAAEVQDGLIPLAISRIEFWVIWFLTDLLLPWIGFVPWWRKERADEAKRLEDLLEMRRLKEEASFAKSSANDSKHKGRLQALRAAIAERGKGRLQAAKERCACCLACCQRRRSAADTAETSTAEVEASRGCCERVVIRVGDCWSRLSARCVRCWPCCGQGGIAVEDGAYVAAPTALA